MVDRVVDVLPSSNVVLYAEARPPKPIPPKQSVAQKEHVAGPASMELITDVAAWTDLMVHVHVHGDMQPNDLATVFKAIQDVLIKDALTATGSSTNTFFSASEALSHFPAIKDLASAQREIAALPKSAQPFELYNATLGRSRMVSSLQEQLAGKIIQLTASELQQFIRDGDSAHLMRISGLTRFSHEARKLYTSFSQRQTPIARELLGHLKYLGLTKNLIAQGENAPLLQSLVKSANFGRLTPEDRGRVDREAPKNVIATGKNPTVVPLTAPVKDASGQIIPEIHDERVLELTRQLTTDPDLQRLRERYTPLTPVCSFEI